MIPGSLFGKFAFIEKAVFGRFICSLLILLFLRLKDLSLSDFSDHQFH